MTATPPRALLIIGALLLSLGVAPASAQTQTPAPAAPERCDLRDPNLSERNEWAKCFTVNATLSQPPAPGQTATLTYEIRAAVQRPDAAVSVELPDALAFTQPPAGATLTRVRASDGTGSATTATSRRGFAPGQTQRFTTTLRADNPGPAEITVRVTAPRPDGGTDAATDQIFLTIGAAGQTSRFGIDAPTPGTARAAATGATPARSRARHRPVPPDGPAPQGSRQPGALAALCSTGTWTYLDTKGVLQASENFSVRVWDYDNLSGPDLLTFGFTAGDGRYNLCYDNADADEGFLVDPYIEFVASNSRWRLRDTAASNRSHGFSTAPVINQSENLNWGNAQPVDPTLHRVVRAFDAVNDFWNWKPSGCWDANDAAANCRQIVINWTPTSADGTYYDRVANDVHLAAADPDSRHTVIHEATHAVMDDVYEDIGPPTPNCNPHRIWLISSPGCAWTEGFAEWVPAAVLNDPYYRWADGSELPLETPTWGTPSWDSGVAVEGRVAGAMIDISDDANEGIWDRFGEGDPSNQWTTFLNGNAIVYHAHFGIDRRIQGFDVGTNPLASVYQNTIDVGFNEPLDNYAELTRPTPTPAQPHHYRYTTSRFWSAVAVRPSAGANYDLGLFQDSNRAIPLASSALPSNSPDYVVVDTNRRPAGDHYAKVTAVSGTANYQIEVAQGTNVLNDGSQTVTLNTGDVVHVRDTLLEPGVPTFFRVVPANAGQDPELGLHASTENNPATFVQGRTAAVASGSGAGPGGAEALSFTSPVRQWNGLVLTNKAGAGTYTLHRDTSAATGSVVINNGAASTTSPNVTLTLAATDDQTGVDGVQISVDGTIDTEPVQPLAASRAVTLPAGTGSKTVLVAYRNRAGMISQPVSDTINLAGGGGALADLRVTALSNPPASRADGASFTASDTTANAGAAAAAASTTRYYLSRDTTKSAGDKLLTGARSVPQLTATAVSSGGRSVGIPVGTAAATYRLLACADDLRAVAETSEANNCKASASTIRVT